MEVDHDSPPPAPEGGLRCAKEIIDQRNALVRALDCMVASIVLNAAETQPTDEHLKLFQEATEPVAKLAASIEDYVRTGG